MVAPKTHASCTVCNQERRVEELLSPAVLRPAIADLLRLRNPASPLVEPVCRSCLESVQAENVEDVLEAQRGDLSRVERDVVQSFRDVQLVSKDVNCEFDGRLSLGDRLADRIAAFGGSWAFITLCAGVLLVWLVVNSHGLADRPFDPYPYILLNLVLSCVAAIQAPLIMMSQNRQEAKDRLQAEHDYRVNLKAELEIRQLSEKVDLLLAHHGQHLLELKQAQEQQDREPAGQSGAPLAP